MSENNNEKRIDNNIEHTIPPEVEFGPKIDRDTGRIEFTDSYTEFMNTFRKESDGTSFQEEEEKYKESSQERRETRRKRQQRRRRIIALCTVVIAVAVIVMFVLGQFNTAYDDEDDFQNFADSKFRKMRVLPDTKDRLITYQYGDSVSFAYRYDPSSNEDLAVFRDQQVESLKKDFEKSVKKAEKNKGDVSKGIFRKDTNHAMLFDSAVYDTGNGALAMAIYAVEYNETGGKMKPSQTSIQTYLLDANGLKVLNPMQLLTPDYKEKTAEYCQEYIQKNYKEDQIKTDAEEYLKESESNYNQLILSNGDMTVFFDEGTVLNASEGVLAVDIPKVYLGTSFRSKVIDRYVDPEKPMVAITYDDGPGGKSEQRILRCLKKNGAVATFFYLGNRIAYDEETVKMAYDAGCEIANHSWDHPDLTGMSARQIKASLNKTSKTVKKVTGTGTELFRPPYGSYNESVLKAADMPAILWSIDTEDWASRDAKAVFKVIKKRKNLDGHIILMHSIYKSTAKATEMIVPYLQEKGYQLVTVSELIKYKTGEAPKPGKVYTGGDFD